MLHVVFPCLFLLHLAVQHLINLFDDAVKVDNTHKLLEEGSRGESHDRGLS